MNLEVSTGHNIVATGDQRINLGDMSGRRDNSLKTATPAAKAQTTNMIISPEELNILEETDPIEAFNLMIKNSALLSKIEGPSNRDLKRESPSGAKVGRVLLQTKERRSIEDENKK